MRRVEYFSGIEITSFCVMDNHFHILAHIPKKQEITENILIDRVRVLYDDIMAEEMKARWKEYRKMQMEPIVEIEQDKLRKRMGNISPFMQCLKTKILCMVPSSPWLRGHYMARQVWQHSYRGRKMCTVGRICLYRS